MRGSGKESSAQQTSVAAIHLVARHPDVYEPCDDSFALVDALLADKSSLLEQRPNVCMEIGCGSGYVITSLALILGDERNNAHFIATDISTAAAQVTQDTLEAHGVQADIIVTDLVRGLEDQLSGAVDVLLFNPPYVPTPEHEVGMMGITASWAGGQRGRTVLDRVLPVVKRLLSSKGLFYLVTLKANDPSEICEVMKKKGFSSCILIQRYTEEEDLQVLKFWRDGICGNYTETAAASQPSNSKHQET
ncbi:hypothetical protein CY35_05G035800 [Sphagnum magellanicum]|nr:hypothetical protein CY35_05G035800 [Sphagnum magellanicum]